MKKILTAAALALGLGMTVPADAAPNTCSMPTIVPTDHGTYTATFKGTLVGCWRQYGDILKSQTKPKGQVIIFSMTYDPWANTTVLELYIPAGYKIPWT